MVDLAIVAVSAEATLPMLERCHALGIPAAMAYASGYAETNEPDGQAKQDDLIAFTRRTGMKVAGPNCMGNANFTDAIFTTFGQSFQPGEAAGNTALLTQSGNMCATVFRMARRAGVTFSHVINTGNEASVDFSDYLDYLAGDDGTHAAVCYIEELRDGPKFLAAAARFRAAGKLLAVYKVGASEKGAEATRSHTAALAGDSAAYDAAFARAGVARAGSLAELADLAYLHGLGKGKIRGNNCGVLSISGAAGAILADALALAGGDTPTFPQAVQDGLTAQIPGHSMVSNPVDLTGNIVNSNDFLFECMTLALRPDDIDVLLLYLPGAFLTGALDQVEKVAAATSKTLIVIDTFAMADQARLAEHGIGYFDDFDRAARAISAYGAWAKGGEIAPAVAARRSSWPAIEAGRAALSETEGKDALALFGVPVVHDALVQTAEEARKAAETVGFPLVAKLVSPDVAHKTEHGLIRLSIKDADAAVDAFETMMAKAKTMNVQYRRRDLRADVAGRRGNPRRSHPRSGVRLDADRRHGRRLDRADEGCLSQPAAGRCGGSRSDAAQPQGLQAARWLSRRAQGRCCRRRLSHCRAGRSGDCGRRPAARSRNQPAAGHARRQGRSGRRCPGAAERSRSRTRGSIRMSDLVEPKAVEIDYETTEPILYEVVDGVAWITMNRPGFNNAQNGQMTYALDDAFQRATQDDAVKCIVLAGNGKHFSAGHDIGTPGRDLHHEFDKRLMFAPHTNKPAAELLYTREQEQYLGMCRRWRDVPKPTIAMVQGACIAGGLMLAWVCDLIVASEDAFFQDPVNPLMGIPGVEYFAHAYELPPRVAKEFLLLGERMSAQPRLQLRHGQQGRPARGTARGDRRLGNQARRTEPPRQLADQAIGQSRRGTARQAFGDGCRVPHAPLRPRPERSGQGQFDCRSHWQVGRQR